jgi:hypothetical protein
MKDTSDAGRNAYLNASTNAVSPLAEILPNVWQLQIS